MVAMNAWQILSKLGQGVAKSVQLIGEGTGAAVNAVVDGEKAVRSSMPITEITSIFNTTDKTLRFVNRETARDEREVLGQSAISLKTESTAGAWIPWYDPPRFDPFSTRRMEVQIDGQPVIYLWQRGDYVYWTNRLDSEGRPAKSYRMAGVPHTGGQRTLVVRYDPEAGYSAFLTNPVSGL